MEMGKSWNGQRISWRGSLCRSDNRITVGVCAREKKARSKHMEAITSRLDPEKFEVPTHLLTSCNFVAFDALTACSGQGMPSLATDTKMP